VRICNLLLGPSPSQACWADQLEDVAGRLEVAMARRHWANAELEALWASAALVWDCVLGDTSESSSLAASLARVVEEDENRINTAVANGVRWGTRFALVAVLSHFPELEPNLELFRSGQDTDLSDDALWPLVSAASDSPASLIPSSLARDPPDDVE
jgi:hypothetical protein